MNVILAKSAGFCFGVKRAVDTVYERIVEKEPLYTFGPIIHNEEVVRDLEEKGVGRGKRCGRTCGEAAGGTVIIRAHGVERGVCEKIQTLGLSIVDATCPFVLKIHRLVERYSAGGLSHCDHRECQPPGGERHQKLVRMQTDTRVIGTRGSRAEKY